MIEFASFVLNEVTGAFLKALSSEITKEVWSKLQRDPNKIALKCALGAAIQRYATSPLHLDLAHPLLKKDGLLTLPAVVNEVTQLVRFECKPNTELIGQQWKAALDSPPSSVNFTSEAKRLLEYLEVELRSTDVFRPAFEARDIHAIADNTSDSATSLAAIETQLKGLNDLIVSQFGTLIRDFSRSLPSIHNEIRDYTFFIEEKTRGFVGRQFVFDEIERFLHGNDPRGYFVIHGEPGIGKTALAAELVKTKGYVHHFNSRSKGVTKATQFLRNICSQLIARYKLERSFIPERAGQDSDFLLELLNEVSLQLRMGERAVIVVDALDEADDITQTPGANVLYLPETLPHDIYIVATRRTRAPVRLHIECEQYPPLYIDHTSEENKTDIYEYLRQVITYPGIQVYIATQGIDSEYFIELLKEKSEGNFMYLHYVVPAIEAGLYKDLKLQELPRGLQGYYERHWQYMRGQDKEEWFNYKLPIMMVLAAADEPVSIDMIKEFSGMRKNNHTTDRINAALQEEEWGQFLQVQETMDNEKQYSLYHASFQDFLAIKDEIEEGVDIMKTRLNISDSFTSELRGDRL